MPYLRRIMLVVGCLSVWVTPLARADSFIIELTNGREMRTSHVWEEGDALKFYTAQGTVGVPKALVKQIRTADRARHDQLSSRAPAPPAPAAQLSTTDGPSAMRDQPEAQARQARGQGSVQQSTQEQGEAGLHAKDANAYRAQKATLTSQLDEANKTYLAASGARNPDAKKAALEQMRAYSKQFYALADEVKATHGGTLPAWWNE